MSKGCVLNLGALDGLDAGMIAQEPGDSPSLVMSQKAVTDLVNQTALGIAPEVNVPRFEQTLYFTGQPITPEFTGFFEGCLEIGGTTSATQAGKYKAAFTPLPGYVWPDGTRKVVEVDWEILKADGLCQLSASSTSVIKGSSASITVTRKENAAVTVTSSDGSIVQGAVSGNVVTLLGSKRGNASITIRTAETTNYTAAEATLPVSVLEVVQVPTQAGTLTYSSAAQSPVWNGYSVPSDALILSGTTSGVNAGEYEAIFSLKDNLCWPDGTTAPKYVKWKINKAAGSLTVSPTSVTLNNANPTATINITQVGDGALTVISSNTGVVTATLDGKTINLVGVIYGTANITISAAEGTNYLKPQSVTVNVTVNKLPENLSDCTPAQIKTAVDAGLFTDLYNVGDATALVPLNGTMGGVTFNNYNVRFRIMDIQDGHPTFMLATNEAGVEIALTPANYGSAYVEANATGICMNRKGQVGNTVDSSLDSNANNYGPNKGGWEKCYCRNTLMAQFKALLPTAWQDIIIPTTVWTDNVGNNSNAAANITSTSDYCFLPDEFELYGTNTYGNQFCNQKQKQWAWPKAGNSLKAFCHDATTTAATWFGRGPYRSNTCYFCGVYTSGAAGSFSAARSFGLRPAFRV